jgi:hypothetical protein
MGGIGSGNRYRSRRKTTVEESLTVAVRDLRGRLHPGAAGTLTWRWPGGDTSAIGYFVTGGGDAPALTLHYRRVNAAGVRVVVRLQTTPTRFGGRRWWFTCPLAVGGVPCRRRVGTLHLPPGSHYFGCRTCHDLTYRSCQEAHQLERLFGLLDQAREPFRPTTEIPPTLEAGQNSLLG